MGNNITIAFNHPFDKSQEIVIYPEIKKRQRPSQVESGVKEEVHGASSSAEDRSLLQSLGNSSKISGKQEKDTSTSHGKVQSPMGEKTDIIVDKNKPSSKWWRRIVNKKIIHKDSEHEEMHKVKENTTPHDKLKKPIEDQPGPSGTHGKTTVLKHPNNFLQNKEQSSSTKQFSKNVTLPSSRFVTHSSINKMKLNANLPSSSRQRSNNFSYNLRELPSSRHRNESNSGKQTKGDRQPCLPSNQKKIELPKHVPAPPIRTRKDTVKNHQPLPLPSQQSTSKYRRPLKPPSHQAPVLPKKKKEDHSSGQNIRKNNQDLNPQPSNQNSRSHCVRNNIDCDSRRRSPVPPTIQPVNEFNFRPSLWARELEPRIIRVPDSRTSIPGTSLEKEDRYNHVKTWILSVQKHYRMND